MVHLHPCQAHLELKAIRETKNPEEKKKKVMARAEAQKAKTSEQKAETARKAKEGFSIMFKAYCAEAGNAGTDVCTNQLLKNLYSK
eukprot:CAMPEP_0181248940 /NCGR_PEP_ID=MMETSP1096-20121128/45461_1 /TAXON_ID=156174 ORGANISM="Chrysochromulina ericina, Strain CCMP281" /NCGR_SAMPLE_ID=MMETSP1096 /ASSEMBLY_ACC=CAM_ASM_000453 /LENGTH=85 /DNA_ID=CAMNT_0023346189 /DNA_START=20 /DNA_END=277 /DNA_ORIENTATION=+